MENGKELVEGKKKSPSQRLGGDYRNQPTRVELSRTFSGVDWPLAAGESPLSRSTDREGAKVVLGLHSRTVLGRERFG